MTRDKIYGQLTLVRVGTVDTGKGQMGRLLHIDDVSAKVFT